MLLSLELSIHDLTRRSTRADALRYSFQRSFNSRPHEEVDYTLLSLSDFHIPFNSRPHEEVDFSIPLYRPFLQLSIHDLTRRSTYTLAVRPVAEELSIHDLTRRSTLILESVQARLNFQFTTSRGGRPLRLQSRIQKNYLSIHDLTRRSTRYYLLRL